ncbi:hypothetical protein PM082_023873 [Marasmius tenuissimus]|nr:hypothetical protein PM082_023873 [Marasmius tenuissimus]
MPSLTLWERISFFPRLLPLPAVLVHTAFKSFFHKGYRNRKLYRVIFDAASRYVTGIASVRQLQWVNGPTLTTYEVWAKAHKVTPVVEVLRAGEGKTFNLYWIGEKSAEHVLICIHGGGFMLPISDFMFTFWLLVQQGVKTKSGGKTLAIAVVDYSLHPVTFPNQLTELIYAINHCLSDGPSRKPANIHLAGDSCGANVILQLVSHSFHPVPGVPVSPIPFETQKTPLRSALLISPWTSLNEQTPSQMTNNADALDAKTLRRWGSMYVSGIPHNFLTPEFDYTPYIKVHHAPKDWLIGMERIVERVYITTGTAECLLDDALLLHERLAGPGMQGVEVKMDIQDYGVHDDPIFDIGAGSKQLNAVGERIIDWLAEGL